MKKKSFLSGLLGLLTLIPLGASAEDVLMPQVGKQVIVVDNPITFYDFKGTESISASSANNSFATTIFKPATEGKTITITFSEVDLHSDGTSWPAKLRIYSGVFDTTSVTYPEAANNVSATTFPETENMLAVLDGTYSNLTYTSTDATGALSCCFHFRYPKMSKGWVATVSAIELKPMAVTSATVDYSEAESSVYAGQNVKLGAVNVVTEGISPADTLKTLSFTLVQNGVYDATKLRLYQGSAAVNATISQSGDTYTFTFNQALVTGDNTFAVYGDVLSTAQIDAVSTFAFTGLSTHNGYTTLTTATPVQQTVIPMVLMTNNAHLIVTIDRETPFYDDGGVDGKISNGFSGSVTFLPAHEGKKVQLDMHDIHIFYTKQAAGLGNQDSLVICNGSTGSKDSVLYVLEVEGGKVDNLTLKSSAENGALTVYLRSKTPSDYYQGSGFEAIVSEFTPQAMVVSSATVSKNTGNTAAGDTGVEMMRFCITTENTEPALQPTLFHFNAGNTQAIAEKATLYYTGSSSVFATTNKAGEATITDNGFTIAASGVALSEGANYFFLTYDVAANAQNKQTVAANLTQIDFSNGTEYKDLSNSEDVLTINNTRHSDCGEKTIDVYGEWQFTHTTNKYNDYSTDYHVENCNQITVFRPTTEGYIIQMDFADFAVYYSSSSYGAKAVFKVYAGQGTSGDLLWEADATNNKVGPGMVRSTAEDGALTILFNPNESASYFSEKGWHATVTEYKPVPMQLESTEVTALSSGALTRGQQGAELLGFSLTTTGDLTPLALQEIQLQLAGYEAVESLVLLQGGETVATAAVESAEVVLTANTALAEGENNFTLALNIKADAPYDTEVSATVKSLKVSNLSSTPATPANKRVVRNIYSLQKGHQRVEVGASPLSFFDQGGADGQTTSYFTGDVTFVPTVPNSAIQVRFLQWSVNGADDMYIYYADTVQTKADVSLSYYTKDIDKLVLVSTAEDGTMNIKYTTSYSTSDGFEIEVSCHELQPLSADSVVVTSVAPGMVTTGSTNVQMLRMAVYVSGDRGAMPVENFNLQTTGDAGDIHIYQTGTAAAFATTAPFATTDTIRLGGTYYYWAAMDIPATAEVEKDITMTLAGVDINKTTVAPKTAVTATVNVISGMHGTYRIGTSAAAKFNTIQSAIDALAIGVDGPVTFLIEPGTYTERIAITEITGASANNTITFRSLTGNRDDVVIEHNSHNTAYGVECGVFTLDGADYITLSNLTFKTTDAAYNGLVYLCNVAQHNTVDSCRFVAPMSTERNEGSIGLVASKAGSTENTNNDYFTLSNSLLEGGYYGAYITGPSSVSIPQEVGTRIIGNTIQGQGGGGAIYMANAKQALIDGNRISSTATTKTSTRAIDVSRVESSRICNNYIYSNLNVNYDGLYIRQLVATKDAPVYVYNNVIDHNNTSEYNSYAINITNNVQNLFIANNTVRTTGTKVYGLYVRRKGTNLQILNNIFQSEDIAFTVWLPSATYVTAFAHNNLYSDSENFAKVGTTEIGDIETWRTTVGSTTDMNEEVLFEANDILRPADKGNLVSGQPLYFVTTDITGRERAAVPTIGAYEWKDKIGTDCPSSEATAIRVFPTITRDMLNISGAEGATVRVMNMQGQEMMRIVLGTAAEAMNVSNLPQGAYLLDVNGTVFRFIKQ